jgi:predicted regulator of Ras-like GTPase activity (Roadblock/LC7/MglB family)
MNGWPEFVRAALTPYGKLQPALPLAELEPGLKRGKVSVTWAQLSRWLTPSPSVAIPADLVLELPLQVMAPLFLAARQPTAGRKELTLGDNIPDLFSPQKAPPLATNPTPQPAPVTAPPAPMVAPPASPPLPVPVAAPRTMGEWLGQPGRKEWQPADIAHAAASWEGVGGAVLAMHDGFPVAGNLPPDFDLETFAGLAVELHTRANLFASSLKLRTSGEVTVTLGDLPVHVCRTPTLFFAVLGRPGSSLPLERINAVARLLDTPAP